MGCWIATEPRNYQKEGQEYQEEVGGLGEPRLTVWRCPGPPGLSSGSSYYGQV